MREALWMHAAPDPLASGELRRLGVPALALQDEDGWSCNLVAADMVASHPKTDVAIVPLRAAHALPLLRGGAGAKVLIELDSRTAVSYPQAGAILAGLCNRIVGVVARDDQASAWAARVVEGAVPVWLIPDPALRRVELAAAALQLGLPPFQTPEPVDAAGVELWFCEPGDHIEAEEVEALAEAWREDGPGRLVVAPRFVRAWLDQAGVRSASKEWSPDTLQQALAEADRCVFLGPETYARARRQVMALRSGAAAVAPRSPAAPSFEPAQVAAGWGEVLSSIRAKFVTQRVHRNEPLNVLVFLDLIQDLDPVLPLLEALNVKPEVRLRVVASDWVQRRSPRVVAEIERRGLVVEACERASVIEGSAPSLYGIDCVVVGAESSLAAHAGSHALLKRARSGGVPTFALQHGVENVGLHHVPGEDDASQAADYLFVWFPPHRTPEFLSAVLRPRLIHVGRSHALHADLAGIEGMFDAFDAIVAVFENLHWSRYDEAWRARFLTDCTEFAFTNPNRAVILKPHHAGLWSVRNRHLIPQWPSNLIVADPTDPFWEPFTAGALVQLADAVITTPSTAALDAVQAGKPVAVGAYGLELPLYAPLPLLQSAADWSAFVAQAGSVVDAHRRAAFLSRTAAGDHPAWEAAACIVAVARESREGRRRKTVPTVGVSA